MSLLRRLLLGSDNGELRRSHKAILAAVLGTIALVAADLGTKSWAQETLARERLGGPPPVCEARGMQRLPAESLVLVEGYLELQYAENCGAAFGLLDDAPATVRKLVFGLAGFLAVVVLFALFIRGSGGRLFAYSVPLIVSGAVGNLIDRGRLGYVVDFIRFHWQDSWDYPTFNVADITITVGVAFLIIDGIMQERAAKLAAKAAPVEELVNEAPPRSSSKKSKKPDPAAEARATDEE